MLKRLLICILTLSCLATHAQQPSKADADSLAYYDELFSAMDEFMDSILSPHSFTIVNIGVGNNYYNYVSSSSYLLESKKEISYTPSIGYFHKNGLGIAAMVNVVNDGQKLNPYQVAVTGSYDYLENRRFATGIGYTRFFTKKDLPFYTSPLQNSVSAYFLYRKFWFKPSVTATYGWGSRSSYEEREEKITSLRLREKGFTRISTRESVNDFSIAASIKHDFYWINVLSDKDFIRLTPQIVFTSGSQQFGLNQSSNTYGTTRLTGTNVLYASDQSYLDDQIYFQPLSLTGGIKLQYSFGRLFIQPQFLVDYYFPSQENNISTLFVVNAGIIF